MREAESIYGTVRFEGDGRHVGEIVLAFENVPVADLYARQAGWSSHTLPRPISRRSLAVSLFHRALSADDGSARQPPPVQGRTAPRGPQGRLLVVDGDGEVVASFVASEFGRAHGWAHVRAAEPLTRRPVWVEDLGRRESWRIDARSCVHLRWTIGHTSATSCPLAVGDPRSGVTDRID